MTTIGNPKYIFLHEPTTGLDPLSRRKVIFHTTHYMDEADILANHVEIFHLCKDYNKTDQENE
ncbi:hypothetical protein BCR32DRAFT_280711 [Anaeromyces robustus]|uniref:Uncharacterized protein n=1 Tax=Anaeromyces robustus TaxID=1754192 RepID=A0A1Y1X3G6_9FUNG|nr:hypothetical protein BCR32DRAFT_280711 [Anaeromyces robustus]|eukprot:ORX80242.1 hypothetical protein BCR32DRAFT_280711 [Anaeromyces robustus]